MSMVMTPAVTPDDAGDVASRLTCEPGGGTIYPMSTCARFVPVVLGLCLLGAAPPERGPMDLTIALGDLRSGSEVAVEQDGSLLTIYDPVRDRILLRADPWGLLVAGPSDSPLPNKAGTAHVRHVLGADGAILYSHGRTSLGAHLTTVAPGQVNDTGLHVLSFDNDDVDIRDGFGRLVFRRHTAPDGTLTERVGAAYGCGCAWTISPRGAVESVP